MFGMIDLLIILRPSVVSLKKNSLFSLTPPSFSLLLAGCRLEEKERRGKKRGRGIIWG
jgi:hypothetical protein